MSDSITNIKLATLEKQIEILDKIDTTDTASAEILNTVKANTISIIDLLKGSSGGVVKSVQRGIEIINTNIKYVDVTIQPVDLSKSLIFCEGRQLSSADVLSITQEFNNNSSFRITTGSTGVMSWQVIEFY